MIIGRGIGKVEEDWPHRTIQSVYLTPITLRIWSRVPWVRGGDQLYGVHGNQIVNFSTYKYSRRPIFKKQNTPIHLVEGEQCPVFLRPQECGENHPSWSGCLDIQLVFSLLLKSSPNCSLQKNCIYRFLLTDFFYSSRQSSMPLHVKSLSGK